MRQGNAMFIRIAFTLGLALCAPLTARAQQPQHGGVLTVIHWPEPTVLNSAINSGFAAAFISSKIHEGLVEYDRQGKPQPQLADRKSTRLNSSHT